MNGDRNGLEFEYAGLDHAVDRIHLGMCRQREVNGLNIATDMNPVLGVNQGGAAFVFRKRGIGFFPHINRFLHQPFFNGR